MRRVHLALAVVIFLAACGGTAERLTMPGIAPSAGGASPGLAGAGSTAAAPGSRSPLVTGSGRPAGGQPGGAPGGGPNVGGQVPTSNPDAGGLGSMSRGFLRPSPYPNINLEIDVAGAAGPSAAVVSNMVGVLERESGKSATQAGGHAIDGHGSGCWNDSEIAAAASQRTTHTAGTTASMLALFLDGSYCSDSNNSITLGLAGGPLGATSLLVFSAQVENQATTTVGPDQFMKAVSIHELGHVLGLINIGYQSQINHEDPAHPHHSSNPGSVMYWEIERGNLIQQFVKGPPQSFDSDDEADLAGLRDGTY